MSYQVTAPCVVVKDEAGAQHMFYDGDLLPDSGLDKDHVKQIADKGMIAQVEGAASSSDDKPAKVDDILAAVGDDKSLAQQYLDEENTADKPRKSLVEKLQAVLAAE